MNQESRF